jgi:hypothetical protein
MPTAARRIVLEQRPRGAPQPSDFRLEDIELSDPDKGEVLVRNRWLSLDPYMRIAMSEQEGIHGSIPLGEGMPGGAVGEVIASNAENLPIGQYVLTMAHGWRDHYVAAADELQPIDKAAGPIHRFLGLYGLTGVTAWGGIQGVLKPREDETIFINAAAGAVGSVAVQLAKAAGARVIACAGTADKCAWLTERLGADAAIDYRAEHVADALSRLAPDGLAMAFDNVGGRQLEIVLDAMAPRGRIALCGAIAQYDGENYRAGPANLFAAIEKHVSLTGFNAGFYFDRAPEIIAHFAELEAAGNLLVEETVVEGLEQMPRGFADLMRGGNRGKMLVKL